MPVDTLAWVTALLFGLLLGWSVARNRADRRTGTRAIGVMTVLGIAAWAAGPADGTQHAMAAVSMSFAGLSALSVALLLESRDRSPR